MIFDVKFDTYKVYFERQSLHVLEELAAESDVPFLRANTLLFTARTKKGVRLVGRHPFERDIYIYENGTFVFLY